MIRIVTERDAPMGVLNEALKKIDELEAVIVLGIRRDGTQFLTTSIMSNYQKIFLVSFAQAYFNKECFECNHD